MLSNSRRRNRGILLAGVVALALSATSCSGGAFSATSGGAQDTDPIKIGMLLSTSGVYAPIAEDMLAGFELYLEENNNKMGGREVELIVEDDEATPAVGLQRANKLIEEDGIDFGTGIISSAVALQVAGAFEEAETPLVISNAIADALTGEAKSEYVFRTSFSSYQASYPVGRWLAENVDGSLYLAAPDYAAGHQLADGVRAGYTEAGGEIAGEVFPAFKETQDYQPYLSQIAGSGAASTYAFFAGSEAANFVKQYDQFGVKDKIDLYGLSLTTPEVLEAQGDSAEGVYNVLPYSWTLDTPRNLKFVEGYRAKTNRNPSFYAAHSYDAAQLIAQAVEAADGNVTDGTALAASMGGVTIDSPRGSLSIDAENHGTVQQMYIARMEHIDGELSPVVVAELGTFEEQPKK